MMALVEAGGVDIIAVDDLSRYSRVPRLIEDLIELCCDGSLLFFAISGGAYDVSTPEGQFRIRSEGNVAAMMSAFISRKVKLKKAQLIEDRDGVGAQRAFGWLGPKFVDGKRVRRCGMEHDKREAAALKLAVRDVLAGATMTSIADRWNAARLHDTARTAVGRAIGATVDHEPKYCRLPVDVRRRPSRVHEERSRQVARHHQ